MGLRPHRHRPLVQVFLREVVDRLDDQVPGLLVEQPDAARLDLHHGADQLGDLVEDFLEIQRAGHEAGDVVDGTEFCDPSLQVGVLGAEFPEQFDQQGSQRACSGRLGPGPEWQVTCRLFQRTGIDGSRRCYLLEQRGGNRLGGAVPQRQRAGPLTADHQGQCEMLQDTSQGPCLRLEPGQRIGISDRSVH